MDQRQLLPLQLTGGRAFAVQHGANRADLYQWNAPLKPTNFRVVLWLNNGIHGSEIIDGFNTFDEAHVYATRRVTGHAGRQCDTLHARND